MEKDALRYIEDLRKSSGMTNQQIAEQSGVPIGSVSRILSGQTKDPSYVNLSAVIIAMGGSMDELSGHVASDPSGSNTNQASPNMNHDELYRVAVEQAIQVSRDAYTHAYTEIQKQHEIELARVKQYLRTKDKWLVAMFAYCIVLTMIVIFAGR